VIQDLWKSKDQWNIKKTHKKNKHAGVGTTKPKARDA
jgi:hypothetical protein